jgi:hypothetical protein
MGNLSARAVGRKLAMGIGTAVLVVYVGVAIVVSTVTSGRNGDDPRYDPGLIGSVLTGKPSAARGYLWPYFVLTGRPLFKQVSTAKDELNRILPAIKATSAFNQTIEEINAQGGQPSETQLRDLMKARNAVAAVEPINEELLNEVYPEFGTMLRTRLFAAITLVMSPVRKDRQAVTAECNRLLREWTEWFDPRFDQVTARIRRITGDR